MKKLFCFLVIIAGVWFGSSAAYAQTDAKQLRETLLAELEAGADEFGEACLQGDVERVKKFLDEEEISPNRKDDSGFTPLYYAVAGNSVPVIETLLKAGAIPDFRAYQVKTPLHLAVALGNAEAARALLKTGISPNGPSSETSPLVIACQVNQLPMVQLLVEAGATVNPAADSVSPLIVATRNGNIEIVKYLLKKGAKIQIPNEAGDAFLMAIAENQPAILELFLQAGAKVNYAVRINKPYANIYHSPIWIDSPVVTPLTLAIQKNNEDIARRLIKAGAILDNHWLLELCGADSQELDIPSIQLLLKLGADPNFSYPTKDTPLIETLRRSGNEEVVQSLLAAKANPNLANNEGTTPLMLAGLRTAPLLLDAKASIHAKDKQDHTPLFHALTSADFNKKITVIDSSWFWGHPYLVEEYQTVENYAKTKYKESAQLVDFLIQKGANVKERYTAEGGPLLLVLHCPDILKTLIEAGADLNVQNKFGETPLIQAVKLAAETEEDNSYENFDELSDARKQSLNLLLQAKANVNMKDKEGNTAIFFAGEDETLMRQLLEAGADVNVQNLNGDTPLLKATPNISSMELLIKAGANVNAANKEGVTPLKKARQILEDTPYGFERLDREQILKTEELLLKSGAKLKPSFIYGLTKA